MIRALSSNLVLLLGVLALYGIPLFVHAEGYITLVGIPGISSGNIHMEEYVNTILRITIIAAALVAVIKLILAGAQYVLSGLVTSKENAKKDIRNALVGLLIILSAVVLLRTINPQLVNLPALPPAPQLILPPYVEQHRIGDAVNTCEDPDGSKAEALRDNCPGSVNITIDASSNCPVLECLAADVTPPELVCADDTCTCEYDGVNASPCVTQCKLRSEYISHSIGSDTVTCLYGNPEAVCSDSPANCCLKTLAGSVCMPQVDPVCKAEDSASDPTVVCYYGFEE